MDGGGRGGGDTPATRRSPVKFFHAVVFVLGGGLAVVWSRWGLVLICVGVLVGVVLVRAKASTMDVDLERRRIDQLRDDLTWLRDAAEHPGMSADERRRVLEVLRRQGWLGAADYETQRAEMIERSRDEVRPVDDLS